MLFVGSGVSGGEEGARYGPSLMPGGNPKAWPDLKNIFQVRVKIMVYAHIFFVPVFVKYDLDLINVLIKLTFSFTSYLMYVLKS